MIIGVNFRPKKDGSSKTNGSFERVFKMVKSVFGENVFGLTLEVLLKPKIFSKNYFSNFKSISKETPTN